jgi:hypothetical protein
MTGTRERDVGGLAALADELEAVVAAILAQGLNPQAAHLRYSEARQAHERGSGVLDGPGLAGCLEEGRELQWRQERALLPLLVDGWRGDELGGVAQQEVVADAGLVEGADADEVLADVGLRPGPALAPADEQLDVRALGIQRWQVVLQAPVDIVLYEPSLLVERPALVGRQEPSQRELERVT